MHTLSAGRGGVVVPLSGPGIRIWIQGLRLRLDRNVSYASFMGDSRQMGYGNARPPTSDTRQPTPEPSDNKKCN